jgi:hypothetical protein
MPRSSKIIGRVIAGIAAVLILMVFVGGDRLRGRFIGSGPWTFNTEEYRIKVTPIVTGLSHPWSLAFLPNGNMLVTERAGRLRLIRGGDLQAQPIEGVPAVREGSQEGLLDIALHPMFEENRLLYLTYSKPGPMTTVALTMEAFLPTIPLSGAPASNRKSTRWEAAIPRALPFILKQEPSWRTNTDRGEETS